MDEEFDGFCWSFNDPNLFQRTVHERRPDHTKWRTMDGKVMKIVDMTDLHIDNAIAYCEKRGKSDAAIPLMEERKRRLDLKYMSVKMECPFCQDTMQRREYQSDPEEGPGWGWVKYAFSCNKCGARGPLHDKHEPKTVQRGTTQRNPASVR